jgi:acyl-coenzyme A synthetase/AMP-(fatty) acid ligase
MSIPLAFIHSLPAPRSGVSLGDQLAQVVTDSGRVNTFLDCLSSTSTAALWSSDPLRACLTHEAIHGFVTTFALPSSHPSRRLNPNDRVILALPTGCENALALLAISSYHTCAPINASCTATELKEDAERLRAKAVVTTRDTAERLELRRLREELGCEIIYVESRPSGPAGLFDMSLMSDESGEELSSSDASSRTPSQLHTLYDQSLVLHTSGTSGKKKVVP